MPYDAPPNPPVSPGGWPPPPPPPPATNTFAILSLVLAFVVAPVGIVFGHLSLSQIKKTNEGGRGLAIAGLVVGYVSVAVAVIVVIAVVVGVSVFSNIVDGGDRSEAAGYTTTTTTPSYDSGIDVDPRFADWKLGLDGLGPVKIGMSTAEVAAIEGVVRNDQQYCDYPVFNWTGRLHVGDPSYQDSAPIGYIYINEAGVVSKISVSGEVDSPVVDTGITGGSSYEDLVAAYGDRLIKRAADDDDADGSYAVNGTSGYLHFYVEDGSVQSASGIILLAGNVTPDTVPNSFRCELAN